MQDVMMGDKFYADAKASGDWGSLGQLDAKTPSERVKWMTKAVDQVKIRVPWMRNGAQVVYPDGNLKWRTQVPSGNKYSGNFDTVKLEGINRGSKYTYLSQFPVLKTSPFDLQIVEILCPSLRLFSSKTNHRLDI